MSQRLYFNAKSKLKSQPAKLHKIIRIPFSEGSVFDERHVCTMSIALAALPAILDSIRAEGEVRLHQ